MRSFGKALAVGPIRLLSVLFSTLVVLSLVPHISGQTFTSSITGSVLDPTGAAVPGVRLELKNMATNDVRNSTSSGDGTYQFNNLIPGLYQITAVASGFKTFVQQNLDLRAQTATTVNVRLEIGGTTEKVEVTAGSTLVACRSEFVSMLSPDVEHRSTSSGTGVRSWNTPGCNASTYARDRVRK